MSENVDLIKTIKELTEAVRSGGVHDPDVIKDAIKEAVGKDDGDHGGVGAQTKAAVTQPERDEDALTPADVLSRSPRNQLEKDFCELNDRVHMVSALTRSNPKSCKAYRDLQRVSKALYSTGTNVGDEFVPTGFSTTLIDEIRIERQLPGLVQVISIPRSPFAWPVSGSIGLPYALSENTADTGQKVPTRTPGTDDVTFTAKTFGVRVPFSHELNEDSIVAVEGFVRQKIARSLIDGLETGMLNGDTAATHQDTAVVTTSNDVRTLWLGFRALAFDRSATYDVTETTTTGATSAFEEGDFARTRKKLGDLGYDPSRLVNVISPNTFYAIIADKTNFASFYTLEKVGPMAINVTGEVGALYGVPTVVSKYLSDTQANTGLGTSASTYTSFVVFNRDAWALANQVMPQIATVWDAEALQYKVIGYQRSDFRTWYDDTNVIPSAVGYKFAA